MGMNANLCNYKAIPLDTDQGLDFELVFFSMIGLQTSAQKLSLIQATTGGFQDGQWLAVAVGYLNALGKTDSLRFLENRSCQPKSPSRQLYLFDRYKAGNLLLSIRLHRMKLFWFSASKFRGT